MADGHIYLKWLFAFIFKFWIFKELAELATM